MISSLRIPAIAAVAAIGGLIAVPAAAVPTAGTSIIVGEPILFTLFAAGADASVKLFSATVNFGDYETFYEAGYNFQDIEVYTLKLGDHIVDFTISTPDNFLYDSEIGGNSIFEYILSIGSGSRSLNFTAPLIVNSEYGYAAGRYISVAGGLRTTIFNDGKSLSTRLSVSTGSSGIPISNYEINTFRYRLDFGAAAAAVPEPGTWALMIAGFGLVGAHARRRRQPPVTAA